MFIEIVVVFKNILHLVNKTQNIFFSLFLCVHIYSFCTGKIGKLLLLPLTRHIFVALSICVHNMTLLKTWEKILLQMYKEGR